MQQITLPDNHIPTALLPEKIEAFPTEENNEPTSTAKPFIEANTIPSTLEDIRNNHIIPVFIKDNETLISQAEFIYSKLLNLNRPQGIQRKLKEKDGRISSPVEATFSD